jgi:putative transposase
MTEYRRLFQPGGCYFFTVVTEGRRPILIENIDRLRRAFRMGLARRPFQIDAIVVLPDHLHAIWRLPEGDSDFSTRWMHIKRCFSAGLDGGVRNDGLDGSMGTLRFAHPTFRPALQAAPISESKRKKREKGVWQRRFWEHAIRDEADWRRHMDYVHYNPVKHGYCAAPRDWRYGSFWRCVRAKLYEPDWGIGAAVGDLDGDVE